MSEHDCGSPYCDCAIAIQTTDELTDSEKIEYVYQVAVKVDAAVREVLPQVGPILESVSKNPMLKMFLR